MADAGVPVAAHRDRVVGLVSPLSPRPVPAADALGLEAAIDVVAALAVPRFDHAAMDGYAVRAADVGAASEASPVTLPVAGVIAAGDAGSAPLAPGAAVRIMTGAPVPTGADAVVPFEWTDRGTSSMTLRQPVAAGRHIRLEGEDVAAGAVALAAGSRVAPRHLGLLASVGAAEVVVRRPRPRVAIITTGAELVARGAPSPPGGLPDGAVPESNSATLAAAVRALGAEPVVVGPAPDVPVAFLELLASVAGTVDLVVTTGGISAGDHDVVKAALRDHDGMWFGRVAVRPGRPQGAGVVDGLPLLCLPGTPIAAYSSFLLFVAPAIRVLAGLAPTLGEAAVLADQLATSPDRTVVLPGRYDDRGRVVVLPGHAGHSQRLLAQAELLVLVPPGERPLAAGSAVDVVRLDPEVER